MSKTINLKDSCNIKDHNGPTINQRLHAGPKGTKIIIKDHNTGKVLGEICNKILVPGSQVTACNQFGLQPVVNFPTYNTELGLDESYEEWSETPVNPPITCLWCVGRDGAGSSPNEVITVVNTDRIEPVYDDIIPFRYIASGGSDLSDDDREIYFGRKEDAGNIAYYFKAFDTSPQLHIEYLDGTVVTHDMYSIPTNQPVEVYIEMRLSITRYDLREYFNEVLGWDDANISTVSLVTAWYDEIEVDGKTFKYYQDIIPFSKFNFRSEDLTDETRAIDFNYQIYY